MRVNRLAAARDAAPRQVLRRIAPRHVRLLPRDRDHFGGNALAVDHRLGAEVADASLDIQMAVRLDDEQSVESDGAADESADRHADAAYFAANALPVVRFAHVPAELDRALVERFLQETARRVRAVAASIRRPEFRLAFRRVDLSDFHLIDAE